MKRLVCRPRMCEFHAEFDRPPSPKKTLQAGASENVPKPYNYT